MLAIRFITSFVLGLLFVLHALKNTFAYAHQGRHELLVTRKDAREEKEDLNCIVTARTKLIGLGRGKMVEYKELRNGNEAIKERNGGTSEISGVDMKDSTDHSHEKSQRNLISQQDIKAMLESNNLESVRLMTPRNETKKLLNSNSKHVQDTKAEPITQETTAYDDFSEKDEARILLEATREIVNLMHKDYRGMGRRKPPINNHEPWH